MKIKPLFILSFLLISLSIFPQSAKKFIIILDAGHGGKDPGNSYNGFVEKDIALQTTLKVEKYLQKDKDMQVICTRKTDVFIELVDRPQVANKAHANLFVSIHCNSVKNPEPHGTETFVMGMSRLNTNFEVAKQENSVILLEKDYKETYKGFDPKNPETLIGLKILQEEYLNSSIDLASNIEDVFTNKLNRKTRGVKQQPLWVLDAAYMPSVLIELGFLSNKEEGAYLNSEEGQDDMAKAIAEAIIRYKNNFFGDEVEITAELPNIKTEEKPVKDTVKYVKEETKTKTEIAVADLPVNNNGEKSNTESTKGVVFKVQIFAANKLINLKPENFKGLDGISVVNDNGALYKYMYGKTSNYDEAKKNLEEAKSKGYTTAYLIAFKDGKRINIQEAIK